MEEKRQFGTATWDAGLAARRHDPSQGIPAMAVISHNVFMAMAHAMADEWEQLVTGGQPPEGLTTAVAYLAGGYGGQAPHRGALPPDVRAHRRITAAMQILSRYYTVLPDTGLWGAAPARRELDLRAGSPGAGTRP